MVEIRRARFLIADLTGGNNGAYWEAGFAEGLGKKVIYTCRRDWADKIHFDKDQFVRVPWDEDSLDDACEDLKGIIRNTFEGEVKMEDATERNPSLGTQ